MKSVLRWPVFKHGPFVMEGLIHFPFSLSLPPPSRFSCPHLNPIMCLVDAERRLEVAHGASHFSASSEVSCADGNLPSVLRTQNVARQQVQQPSFSDLWAGEKGRQASLISNRMHLCVFWRRPLKEVLPYFQDKLSFMRAMCWTNQVNWEARNSHWVYLSFLLKAKIAQTEGL